MSDLNHLINSWRSSMADLSDQQLDELEDHLREQVAALRRQGLSTSEAFAVATMRCGRPAELAHEFAQADPAAAWSHRLRWMVAGFLLCAVANWLIMGANTLFGLALIRQGLGLSTTITLRMFFLTVLIAVVIAVWHRWWWARQGGLATRAPGWVTSGWTLSIAVATLPCLYTLARFTTFRWLDYYRPVTPQELGELALTSYVTGLVLPFTAPLVLLLIAISLSKHRQPLKG